jgi:hypothetical protein
MDKGTTESTDVVGFTLNEATALLLKKYFEKASTNSTRNINTEPTYPRTIFTNEIAGDYIPVYPPDDFVTISNAEIVSQFGILEEEISRFNTTVNGVSQFSIQRSASLPHIYKINNCQLRPWPANPDMSFCAVTPRSKVNILKNTLTFTINGERVRGTYYRTDGSGGLSRNGMDIVRESHLAFVYDTDSGFLTLYDKDNPKNTPNPLGRKNPPAITCYVYRGVMGFSNLWGRSGNTIYRTSGQVLIGTEESENPSAILDVSGVALIRNVICQSAETYSDIRLKTNIEPFESPRTLLDLGVYSYNYKRDLETKEVGLIAQEVERVAPELVREHDGFKSVQYDRLGALLLPIVKEQSERIKALETKVEALLAKPSS